MRVIIGMVLIIFLITGCQSQKNIEEVINKHNDIQNLEGLNKFVENVNKKNQYKINYVRYGIEGQRGVNTLTFDGEKINVSHSVNGNFVEKYNCKEIIVNTEKDTQTYVLIGCSGDYNGDFELLTVSNKSL